jgi:Bacterial self-protective colicin-like immunity
MTETKQLENLAKLKDYAALINEYLSEKISVLDFEQKYFEMFKMDETLWIGEDFDVLNGLFGDLDAFCYDSTIRTSEDLDEFQLRNRAEIASEKLKRLLEFRLMN